MGWRNFFFQLCCCVSFLVVAGNSFRCYLPTITVLPLCLFLLRREIVLGCTNQFFGCGRKQFQVLLTYLWYHTSCAVVSFFCLRWEIVFGCKVSKKDLYSVSLIERESASKCVYFLRSNTFLLCISLLYIYLFTIQIHRLTDQIVS